MTIQNIAIVLAGTATALMAGLFFAFSVAANRGLAQLPDTSYLAAMQATNRRIVNPPFVLSFLGAPVLLPLATLLHLSEPGSARFGLLVAASVVYLAGGLGVTVVKNFPLNNRLATFDIEGAGTDELATARGWFEQPWNRWNAVRTVASTVAVALVLAAGLGGYQ